MPKAMPVLPLVGSISTLFSNLELKVKMKNPLAEELHFYINSFATVHNTNTLIICCHSLMTRYCAFWPVSKKNFAACPVIIRDKTTSPNPLDLFKPRADYSLVIITIVVVDDEIPTRPNLCKRKSALKKKKRKKDGRQSND